MVSAVIVAAGEGERFKSSIPKLYLGLGGKPIIVHSLLAFYKNHLVKEIVLVIRPGEESRIKKILSDFSIKVERVVTGGTERQDSVERGLSAVSSETDIILIHDGARPLVSKKLIGEVIKEAEKSGAVVPAFPCEDTIKEVKNGAVLKTPKRNFLWAVQTPQGFKKDIILSAYKKSKENGYYGTDDAELVENFGGRVRIVPGEKENIKITRPVDLVLAEAILKKKLNDLRIKK